MLRAARENTLPFRSHRLQEKTQTKIPPISCAGWARSPAVWLQGAPHDALGESVHPAPLAVPRGRLEGLVALRGSDGRGEGLAERRLLLLAGGERGAALRLLCVAAEAVPRHLEHQDAAVALGELAALEKVHRAEAGVAHQRVRADLLLEPPAEVDRRLDCLDLCRAPLRVPPRISCHPSTPRPPRPWPSRCGGRGRPGGRRLVPHLQRLESSVGSLPWR